jgi:hypothetical protein
LRELHLYQHSGSRCCRQGYQRDWRRTRNELVYKYIPAVGEKGKADGEYAIVVPHAEEVKKSPSTVTSVMMLKKASIRFHRLDKERLPTLHHVVETLFEIPIYEVLGAMVVEGLGGRDLSSARRIE